VRGNGRRVESYNLNFIKIRGLNSKFAFLEGMQKKRGVRKNCFLLGIKRGCVSAPAI
jgi:hypothetical protein